MSKTKRAILNGSWPGAKLCPACGASCRETDAFAECLACDWMELKIEEPDNAN